MSVLCSAGNCALIDHRNFILNHYKNVTIPDQETESFAISAKLFSIKGKKDKINRKRSHYSDDIKETATIKQTYESFLQEIPKEIKMNLCDKYNILDTKSVRDLSRQYFEGTLFDHSGISGGNNSEYPLKCKVKDEYFLIPPKSRFYSGCVKEQCKKLEGDKFDVVIADPPWWNKYIRRLKGANAKLSYTMMYNEDIASIPVKTLLSTNCLVAVWCTNSPSNINAIKDLIFPNWGVEYLTTWYWLKVTVDLEPLCGFGMGSQKQPFERLVLGRTGNVNEVPENRMFMSVPSALHSHKPPLLDLLSPYIEIHTPRTLELFARYLLPNTTSVGFEPLKWQHISLYETVS